MDFAFLWVRGCVFVLLMFVGTSLFAQCGYGGTNYGDVTPGFPGDTFELLNFVWGGDQYTLQANAGCTYVVSLCGSAWDTQITVFDPTLTSIAYNDDYCGLQSQVTFTALTTGPYTIQVNQFFCATNASGAAYFGVTLVSCPNTGGCNDPVACNYNFGDTDAVNCCYDECLTFTAGGGAWDGEISWDVYDGGVFIASGIANTPNGIDLCLPEGCYTVNMYDSFGDGWNGAVFSVQNDGVTVYTGTLGAGSLFSDTFCTEYIPPPEPCYSAESTGCPEIDLGADIVLPECTDPCVDMQLTADVFESGETTSYEVCSIDYTPPFPFNSGTGFSIGTDDVWSPLIDLPFDFCFYGTNYSQIVVGSNGLISFELAYADGYCPYAFNANCPSADLPRNSIFGAYHDIDPSVCGGASYAILGVAPCRVFVVNYNNVCHFSCNSLHSTSQIVLYETTNAIEVYIEDKETCLGWNSGNALIGIQNAAGSTGLVANGRQTGPWSASNEAWRFTPTGVPNFTVNWFGQDGYIGSGLSMTVCPSEAIQSYAADAVYTRCDGTEITVSDFVTVTCALVLLPVEWLSFQALLSGDEQDVDCVWRTATELNNDYFSVERSADAKHWEVIGTVQGAGTSSQESSYVFKDQNPLPDVSYYRVRQTDFNGEKDWSTISAVKRNEPLFLVYPNPGNGVFRVQGVKPDQLLVFDASGREVPVQWVSAQELSLVSVAKGCYVFQVTNAQGNLLRERVIVQ
jgi:hypothetical protein